MSLDGSQLRDVAWLAGYLNRSRQWVSTNASTYGGFRAGREWRFTDAGIEAGIDRLQREAQGPTPAALSPGVTPRTASRIGRQLRAS